MSGCETATPWLLRNGYSEEEVKEVFGREM